MRPKVQQQDFERLQAYLKEEDPVLDTPRTERVKTFLQSNPTELYDRKNMQGHVTASLLVLSPDEQSVLVIEHQHLQLTLHPGGHIDMPDDSFMTAFKECEEETGLRKEYIHAWAAWPLDQVFDVDSHRVAANPKKNEGDHLHHDITYIGKSNTWDLPPVQDLGALHPRWIALDAFESTSRRSKSLYAKIRALKLQQLKT